MYKEDEGLKTNKGGLKHQRHEAKEVTVFPVQNREQCLVSLFTHYCSLLPRNQRTDALYLRPKKNYSPGDWFVDTPMGVNALTKVMKSLCEKGGLLRHYTNHSLGATSVTHMFQSGLDEKVITEISGHHWLAVREYQQTNVAQKRFASSTIAAPILD